VTNNHYNIIPKLLLNILEIKYFMHDVAQVVATGVLDGAH